MSSIKESIDLIVPAANLKGLVLSYKSKGPIPENLSGDASRIRQILVNLLSNAVKFTDKGEIEVAVEATELAGNGYEMHFSVRDTGIGISRMDLDRIFQPFTQADASTSKKYGGTGLGLAISRKLVELMGGRIWVESTHGKGSIFHFTIMVDITSAAPVKTSRTLSKPLGKAWASKDLRILLAEDNLVSQKVALLMLNKLGCKADVVADGFKVLQALERQTYDLVLMDVQMPEMDGLEATRIIRQRWPDGPKIIAITAYALEGDRERCLEAGMDGYIAKPVQKDDLAEVLEMFSQGALKALKRSDGRSL
jgi:CheY-like chemotaxis protein